MQPPAHLFDQPCSSKPLSCSLTRCRPLPGPARGPERLLVEDDVLVEEFSGLGALHLDR